MERSLRRPAHTAPAQLERLLACRPDLAAPRPSWACRRRMLLSFERPSAQSGRVRLAADLENCTTMPTNGYHRVFG